jgi:hypothetical protein
VIAGRLAGSERPGGFARTHRKVRRQEELIWLKHQGFTMVVSLLDSPHNLHAYEEFEIPYLHVPLGRPDEALERLPVVYEAIASLLDDPESRVLVHHEEFGDRIIGVLGGYLLYAGLIESGTHAIQVIERLTNRNLGADGREIIASTVEHRLRRSFRKGP